MNRTFAILRAMAHRPSGAIGLALVLSHLVLALISPWIVPFDYKAMNALQTLTGPSSEHWLGTDHLGRDVLTRVLLGGREALVITGIATPIALLWGGLLGVYLGLRGGWADDITLRLVDAFLALPGILPLLVLITVFGSGGEVLMPTLAFFFGIPVIRVARAAAHEVVARDFIAAARARGHRPMDIVRRELLPNVTDVLLVEGAMRWSWMLLGFSALSFLGFGVAPPRPDWGLMVSDARVYMSLAPWGVIAPVVALSSLIIGINLSADALAKTLGLDQSRAAVV
ncbi:MAG: ABC transporter permease [Roseovarius sp.]|jgi:peptide/nickel transport system permease protein|uniref:ABC transporter permease n=1 Tax=Roseovarius sp. TaxID=1486281 RepID=UPI00262582B8|nr:ABC transporter permease [Roseovarius sp.]